MEHNITPYQFIEKVGRTCYKSEDKITEGSAEKFVEGLIKRQHWAMLEHETIYFLLYTNYTVAGIFLEEEDRKFFNVTESDDGLVISGSFRSFYEFLTNKHEALYGCIRAILKESYPLVFQDFRETKPIYPVGEVMNRQHFMQKFIYEPKTLFKHLTHTVKFVCDRGVSHEFVRHRVASFAQESTRYCNYSKDKFGNEITVIEPCFWDKDSLSFYFWKLACETSENIYTHLLTNGATPQEARSVLPNSLKTELIITATEEEWQHIVNLRYLGTTGSPHPQIKEVMGLIINDLIKESNQRIKGDK